MTEGEMTNQNRQDIVGGPRDCGRHSYTLPWQICTASTADSTADFPAYQPTTPAATPLFTDATIDEVLAAHCGDDDYAIISLDPPPPACYAYAKVAGRLLPCEGAVTHSFTPPGRPEMHACAQHADISSLFKPVDWRARSQRRVVWATLVVFVVVVVGYLVWGR